MSCVLDRYPSSSKLNDGIDILRVKKNSKKNFIKEENSQRPPPDLFNLSSSDKEEGEHRSKQPLLSVWKSSIKKEHLFSNIKITEKDLPAVYKLNVGSIHSITVEEGMIPIELHHDPQEVLPSGQLHAGMQGLYRMAGIGKVKYKNLKDELVKISNLEY